MAEPSTYIKLDRNISKWRWYQDANTTRLFIHLLLNANIEPRDFQKVTIQRGELATSYAHLAQDLGLSVKNVRTALEHLKATGEVASTKYSKFQVISIVNYCKYQDKPTSKAADNRQADGNQAADNRQADGNQAADNRQQLKNDKNIRTKELKKDSIYADKPPRTRSYGEYGWIKLTDEQYQKLVSDLGQTEVNRCIRYIDESAQSNGNKNKWKDWNLVIRKCNREGWGKNNLNNTKPKGGSMSEAIREEDYKIDPYYDFET